MHLFCGQRKARNSQSLVGGGTQISRITQIFGSLALHLFSITKYTNLTNIILSTWLDWLHWFGIVVTSLGRLSTKDAEGHGRLCFTERPRMKRIERMLVALAIGFPSTIDPPPRERFGIYRSVSDNISVAAQEILAPSGEIRNRVCKVIKFVKFIKWLRRWKQFSNSQILDKYLVNKSRWRKRNCWDGRRKHKFSNRLCASRSFVLFVDPKSFV